MGDIAISHILNSAIVQHIMTISFIERLDNDAPEVPQDEFASDLRRMDVLLNTEERGKQFGPPGVYDATKTNWANQGKGHPG